MPALVATDVTVTIQSQVISNRKRYVMGTIAFGDGALTYPTAGVPLPANSAFGMIRDIDVLLIDGQTSTAPTSAYLVRYNKADHKLQLFEEEAVAAGGPLLEADTSEAPAAITYNFMAVGW